MWRTIDKCRAEVHHDNAIVLCLKIKKNSWAITVRYRHFIMRRYPAQFYLSQLHQNHSLPSQWLTFNWNVITPSSVWHDIQGILTEHEVVVQRCWQCFDSNIKWDYVTILTILLRMSSWTFLWWWHNAQADEWLKMTGDLVTSKASLIVFFETWERSTSMPNRFISNTTTWN